MGVLDERSEEVWTGAGVGVGAGVAVPEWDGWVASGAEVLSGAELVVGGALLLVVATGVGRSVPVSVSVLVLVPVLLSAPVFVSASVSVLPTVPESEWEVSMPSVPVVCVVSVPVLSELVFSGRPVVVVRGLPPPFEDVPEPDVGLPVFVPVPVEVGAPEPVVLVPVPVPVVVVGGTTLVLDPFATGTSGEGAGVEVFEVSEEVEVSSC